MSEPSTSNGGLGDSKQNYDLDESSVIFRDILSEHEIWTDIAGHVWKCNQFIGQPHFYPVYQYKNYYSYSIIPLIKLKGHLFLNKSFQDKANCNVERCYSGSDTIDSEVNRVGGIYHSSYSLRDKMEYAERIVNAVKADISTVISKHPDYQNVVLCGGKDSLNLLLLDWPGKLIVLSAAPNTQLVQDFVVANGLRHEVFELMDQDTSTVPLEILYNACLNNLQQCRWTGELKTFSERFDKKIIFWKGQLGNDFMTPVWRTYFHRSGRFRHVEYLIKTKVVDKLIDHFDPFFIQNRFFKSLWLRGAMWQGAHMSLLRSVCGGLFLSAYHGELMEKVLQEVDLNSAVTEDIRPLIGKILHGSTVKYPAKNPGPPISKFRSGLSDTAHFCETFKEVTKISIS